MNPKPPPFQFSVVRLTLALGVFGVPFAFFADRGPAGIALATVVGSALTLVTLIVRRKDSARILNVLICIVSGAILGDALGPTVVGFDGPRSNMEIQSLRKLIAGAAIGGIVGWFCNLGMKEDEQNVAQ